MVGVIRLKIHVDVLVWMEIPPRQMAQGKDPNPGCATGLLRDYSSFSVQRLRILHSQYIILHYVLRSALRSLYFEVLNIRVFFWHSDSPVEANVHVFWSLLKEVIDTRQGGEEGEMGYITEGRKGEITRSALLLSNLGRFWKGILSKRAWIPSVYLHQQGRIYF